MKNYVKTISLCLGFASLTFAQTTTAPIYSMSIVAGIPTGNSLGDGGLAVFGVVSSPQGIALTPPVTSTSQITTTAVYAR